MKAKCGMRIAGGEFSAPYAEWFDVIATGPAHVTLERKDGSIMTFSRERVEEWIKEDGIIQHVKIK